MTAPTLPTVPTTALLDGQFQLDDGPVFGWRTRYTTPAPEIGEAEIADQDADVPGADGIRPGRDRRRKRVLTFDVTAGTERVTEDIDEFAAAFEAAWLADPVRQTPGARSVLRYGKAGTTRRVYGRARKIAPVVESYFTGRTDFTAEFEATDYRFYDDEQQAVHVAIVPPTGAGLTTPATTPFVVGGRAGGQGQVTVGGSIPTPVSFRVNGPVTRPRIEVVGKWFVELTDTLASDDYVDIDPFAGTVVTRFAKNWAGKFTQESQHLPDLLLSPGPATVVLYGTDSTGTASLDVSWRAAHATF